MKLIKTMFLTLMPIALLVSSCTSTSIEDLYPGPWLIPVDEVEFGGPGKDGIPSIDNPKFISQGSVNYLNDSDLVVGVLLDNTIRAYPHNILNYHEIVNDQYGGTNLALTYCPLTGSALAWLPPASLVNPQYGVSGLLYNSNLIPYDRETDSNWSQMAMLCVQGERIGELPVQGQTFETTWSTWKQMFPNTTVLSTDTGISRPYLRYPYGTYRTDRNVLFPVSNRDTRLHPKERVLGVISGTDTRVYIIDNLSTNVEVINQAVGGIDIVVVGSSGLNFAAAFKRELNDGTVLSFQPVQNELPVVLLDNEGTKWDVFGVGVSGPRAGSALKPTASFVSYWFAWAAFFPNADIHNT
jgi:hypothetical protein